MREGSEKVESKGTYVTEGVSCGHFYLAMCYPRALVVITWRGEGCCYMMRLGLTVKICATLENHGASSLGGGSKSWYIIIILNNSVVIIRLSHRG